MDFAIVPGSPLEKLLTGLPRPERRLMLATITGARTKRRARLQRQLKRRLVARGR